MVLSNSNSKALSRINTLKYFEYKPNYESKNPLHLRPSISMTLYRKVQAVERVFKGLEKDLAAFKHATKISCISGCGTCCFKADISASPIEFLPLAYQLHKQGVALDWYEKLRDSQDPMCTMLSPVTMINKVGFCKEYNHRGLICRLFGYAAALNKHGEPQLVTCKPIKEQQPEAYQNAVNHIAAGKSTPIMRHYYFQLQAIDGDLSSKLMPINKAVQEALKVVLSYYAYRKPRSA